MLLNTKTSNAQLLYCSSPKYPSELGLYMFIAVFMYHFNAKLLSQNQN